MERYDKYKDSGVEWIGEIPEHWDCKRLRYLGICQNGVSKGGDYFGSGFPFVSYGDVYNNFALPCNINGLAESSNNDRIHYSVIKGDVFFTRTSETAEEIGFTSTCTKTLKDAIFSGFLIRFRPLVNNLFVGFSKYYFRSTLHRSFFVKSMNLVTRASLSQELLKKLPVMLPPFLEQTIIATYLDHKTTQIDALITQKEQLLTLYEEERAAIINQAVTKGINPDVKFKDSGIDWLGEIPEHWEVTRMRFLTKIKTGEKDTENKEISAKYPFFVRSQQIERISSYSFDGEAILTAGDGVGVGKVFHYINGKFDYHQRVYKISHFSIINAKFLFYYMKQNFKKEVLRISAKSTVESLRLPMLQNFPVCISEKQEQTAIVQHIESETTRINAKIKKTRKLIALQKEYRTALISEVVTGKVKITEKDIL